MTIWRDLTLQSEHQTHLPLNRGGSFLTIYIQYQVSTFALKNLYKPQVLIQLSEYLLLSVCTEIRVSSAYEIYEPALPLALEK